LGTSEPTDFLGAHLCHFVFGILSDVTISFLHELEGSGITGVNGTGAGDEAD
jgi:hypothetical protein